MSNSTCTIKLYKSCEILDEKIMRQRSLVPDVWLLFDPYLFCVSCMHLPPMIYQQFSSQVFYSKVQLKLMKNRTVVVYYTDSTSTHFLSIHYYQVNTTKELKVTSNYKPAAGRGSWWGLNWQVKIFLRRCRMNIKSNFDMMLWRRSTERKGIWIKFLEFPRCC